MKIRMLVDGHKEQTYELKYGKMLLQDMKQKGHMVVDDTTKQLAKIEFLTEDSQVTVYPTVIGG